jgi:hypothetical protein
VTEEFFILELASEGCSAEAYLNAVPVSRVSPESSLLDSQPVNHLLAGGPNLLTLLVEPGPTPARALESTGERTSTGNIRASMKLMVGPQGTFAEDPDVQELADITWSPPAGGRFQTPVKRQTLFNGAAWWPQWSWQSAAPITLSPPVVQKLLERLRYLSDSLAHRDPEPFIQLARVRFAEVARAYQLDPDDEIQQFREQFQTISSEPDFKMEPVNPETMDLRLCGDRKLVDCVGPDWLPLIRTARKENGLIRLRYPIKLAELDKQWQIVR